MLLLISKMEQLEGKHMVTLLGIKLNMRYMRINSAIYQKLNLEWLYLMIANMDIQLGITTLD